MSGQSSARVAVVGIDGFSPLFLKRYLEEGVMPALRSLVERGVSVPLVSTLPATTPVAWSAMSTGTYPSTNGIEGFLLHRSGRSFDDRISGVYCDRLTAEPLWQTAHLNGLASFVVKFPVSYPSTTASLRIDGAAGWGGLTCLHEVAAAGTSEWSATDASIEEASAWTGTAPNDLSNIIFARLTLHNVWGQAPAVFHLAVGERAGVPALAIACAPDWELPVTTLAQGEWSEPIVIDAISRRGTSHACALRFKALELARDPLRLRLFNTPLHEVEGHSNSDVRWRQHLGVAGPIEEQTDPSLLFSGAIDVATHVERCRLNTDWLSRISHSILTSEPWDLFMVQTHIVDWAHHILHGAVDPRHPLHDPVRADEAESLLRLFYSMADELVANVIAAAGPDADIVVMGDHGQDLHHTTVRFNQWLAERGELVFADVETGTIDWVRTRACVLGNGLYINLAGRDPQGIVTPVEYEGLVETLCRGLSGVVDPRNGDPVVLIAAPREHFAYLGGHGRGTGDAVFALHSGYQARNDPGPMFELTRPWHEFTSGHDHFWPLDPRLQTRMVAAGPHFTQPPHAQRLRPIVDVAPTIAAVLGITQPQGIDGTPIDDVLAPQCAIPALRQIGN